MNSQAEASGAKQQLYRQIEHWTEAAARLQQLEDMAAPMAWSSFEAYKGTHLRKSLTDTARRLHDGGLELRLTLDKANNRQALDQIQLKLNAFRKKYFQVETTIDFFTDAINTRTNTNMAELLGACDYMASRSMHLLLHPLGIPTPPVLTYITEGRGASILKKDIKLWDRETTSPVAAIKIVRHNLLRPTSLIHESGHQVAHVLNWNQDLAAAIRVKLLAYDTDLANTWASWASEMAADAYAFVHTGYAAVTSLHDILVGEQEAAFRYFPGDPHPVNYLRVLLNIAFCRLAYGAGEWDNMEKVWLDAHPLSSASPAMRQLVAASIPILPQMAACCLTQPLRALKGYGLSHWIDPQRVSFGSLLKMDKTAGSALFSSPYWLKEEALRLLAYHGYLLALHPERAQDILARQQAWMRKLGAAIPH